MVIPYTAGGVAETIMRLFAVSMEQRLGQKLVIEAKPGAAGNIGTQEVARAAPDGYTILVAATNNFVINQFLLKMTFDPMATLAPIAKAADVPLVLFSNPAVPARTLGEFIAYARANPGKLNYGIPSLGTVNHLLMERLKQTTGADITRIPFRGSPEATLALLKNDIQLFPIGLAVGGEPSCGKASSRRSRSRPSSACRCCRTCRPSRKRAFPVSSPRTGGAWRRRPARRTKFSTRCASAVAEAQKTALVAERFAAMGMLVPTLDRAAICRDAQAGGRALAGDDPARQDNGAVKRRMRLAMRNVAHEITPVLPDCQQCGAKSRPALRATDSVATSPCHKRACRHVLGWSVVRHRLKPQRFMLARPFGRHVAEPGHADASGRAVPRVRL